MASHRHDLAPPRAALTITQVESADQVAAVASLLRAYLSWTTTLGADATLAPTFSGVDEEMARLPGRYALPAGRLLLAACDGAPIGCIALKPRGGATGELKRFYVRPDARGLGIGRRLVSALIREARSAGYRRLVLDSHASMTAAHAIYSDAGFRTVDPPSDFPAQLKPVVVFMELDLT